MKSNACPRLKLTDMYLFLSFFCFIYVFFNIKNENYRFIYFLPLSYLIFNLICKLLYINLNKETELKETYKGGIAYLLAITTIFIRYVLTPVTMIYTNNFSGVGLNPNKNSINLAIVLMVIELLMVLITLNFSILYYSHKKFQEYKVQTLPLNMIIFIFAIGSLLVILLTDYHLIIPKDFLLIDNKREMEMQTNTLSEGFAILANCTKMTLFIMVLSFLKNKYDVKLKKVFILFSFLTAIIYMGLMTNSSRWDMLFSCILCMYLIKIMYKKVAKIYFILIAIIMVASVISISLYKFSWYISNAEDPMGAILKLSLNSFQGYFSGPRVVAQAIDMNTYFGKEINLSTFVNDLLGSIPLLAKYINQTNRINPYFNMSIGLSNTSQIIPMIGIGYSYLPMLPFVFSSFCEWLVIKIDYKIYHTPFLEFKFLYLFIALYLVMCMGFNTQIIFAAFCGKFLPLYLLFYVNRKISLCLKE